MSNYVIWRFESYPKALALKDLSGLEKSYRINNGEPLEASFPSNVTYHQHADYPDDVALGDTLLNSDMLIVGSKRLASFLASRSIPKLESLPVRIVDRKGSELSSEYSIINPIEPIACLDTGASVYETDLLDPDSIDNVTKLVLDESKIPADRLIFRMQGYWNTTFVHRSLAQAIAAQTFSGIRFLELSAFPET
ncbi:hypothetical protein AKJ09_07789 [Labilithrix luteola]|uniref:Immunity MXAN-0049 protein domain-containing protein n=1 Tax=Labilithrix luteola TaxID=1391654 RepID=A0A0K1Q5M3_9BACT|nr:hypothetical protein [Labilithrix luteola]AKV01126.1 hypothetical protein AKJ09_07789 [Labilithrix luteola]